MFVLQRSGCCFRTVSLRETPPKASGFGPLPLTVPRVAWVLNQPTTRAFIQTFDKIVRQVRMDNCLEGPKHPRLIAGGAHEVGGSREATARQAITRAPKHKRFN